MRDEHTPRSPPTGHVVPMPFRRPALLTLRNSIRDEVFKHVGQISLAEAIGVLEIVKQELITEHK